MSYRPQNAFILAWQPNLVQKVVDSQPWSPNTPLKHLIVNLNATISPKGTLFYKPPITHPPLSLSFILLTPYFHKHPLLHWSVWGLKNTHKSVWNKEPMCLYFQSQSPGLVQSRRWDRQVNSYLLCLVGVLTLNTVWFIARFSGKSLWLCKLMREETVALYCR